MGLFEKSDDKKLLKFARKSNLNGLLEMLKKGANIEAVDHFGQTPLLRASHHGNVKIATALLDRKANVNAKDKTGKTPLMNACYNGHIQLVKMLLDQGADVNATEEKWGFTALCFALISGNFDIASLLIDKKADMNVKFRQQLHKGTISSKTFECNSTILLAFHYYDLSPNQKSDMKGVEKIVKRLINEGVEVNVFDKMYNKTPLMFAASWGNIEIAKILLDKGVGIDDVNKDDDTALIMATINGQVDMVKFLIQNGADVNKKTHMGVTALWRAENAQRFVSQNDEKFAKLDMIYYIIKESGGKR